MRFALFSKRALIDPPPVKKKGQLSEGEYWKTAYLKLKVSFNRLRREHDDVVKALTAENMHLRAEINTIRRQSLDAQEALLLYEKNRP